MGVLRDTEELGLGRLFHSDPLRGHLAPPHPQPPPTPAVGTQWVGLNTETTQKPKKEKEQIKRTPNPTSLTHSRITLTRCSFMYSLLFPSVLVETQFKDNTSPIPRTPRWTHCPRSPTGATCAPHQRHSLYAFFPHTAPAIGIRNGAARCGYASLACVSRVSSRCCRPRPARRRAGYRFSD